MSSHRYIALWLEAPLMSFGGNDRKYIRNTLRFPSRATLWGVVFSAAGWLDDQTDRLAELKNCSVTVFGYKPDHPVLSDYQIVGGGWDTKDRWQERMVPHTAKGKTVAGPSPTRPLIKEYLQDAVFSAVLEFPAIWEDDLRRACASPHDALFIGRKACLPTVPILQGVAESFEKAVAILDFVRDKRNEFSNEPVFQKRIYSETTNPQEARWHLNDVPVAFRPKFEYGWRYVKVDQL